MKSYQITGKSISEVNIPQVLDDIYSDTIETPKEENNCEINISKLTLKKSLSKSNTFENYINDNIMYNNNIYIKNENSNSPNKEEMKKSRTFNDIDAFQNVKYNFHFNNGQNYLETVLETLNEVSNSKIDISGINEDKNKDKNNIPIYMNEKKNKIELKINDVDIHENKIKFQESENNGSSWLATLSGTNTKKNVFPFK